MVASEVWCHGEICLPTTFFGGQIAEENPAQAVSSANHQLLSKNGDAVSDEHLSNVTSHS